MVGKKSRSLTAALVLVCLLESGALGATKYWIGPASGSFAANAHWSLSSGGGNDTTAPGAADVATFDGGGTAACNIESGITVQGMEIKSGYSGSITQYAGASIVVGTSGYAQADGSFAGGAGDLTTEYFTLSGGAFTAPAGTLNIQNTSGGTANKTNFAWTGGTFNNGGGTLKFRTWFAVNGYPVHYINLDGKELTARNLVITGGNYPAFGRNMIYQLGAADKFIVEGDLTLEADRSASQYAQLYLRGGSIEVHGNLTVNPGILGDTTTLKLAGGGDQTYTYTGGTMQYSLEIDKTGGSVTPGQAGMNFPAFNFTLTGGEFVAPGGLFSVSTNYIQNGGVFTPGAGDVTLNAFTLAGGEFTAPTGTMTIACTKAGNTNVFTLSGGTFNPNCSTLKFRSWLSTNIRPNHSIDLGGNPLTVSNLVFTGGNYLGYGWDMNYVLGAADKFVVKGDLTLEGDVAANSNADANVNGGSIELHGDLTVNAGILGGTTSLKLAGDAEQAYTLTGGVVQNSVEIDKTGGAVLPGSEGMNFPAINFTLTSGAFTAPGGLFSVSTNYIQNGGVFTPGTGDVRVARFILTGGEFTAPTGTMTVASITAANTNVFVLAGGTFNPNNVSLKFRSWYSTTIYPTHAIDLGGNHLTVGNLVFTGGNYLGISRYMKYALGAADTFVVEGSLVLEADLASNVNARVYVDGGGIEVQGDLTVNGGILGGTASLALVGGKEQSLTQTGGTPPTNSWTLDKSGGSVSLATDFSMSGKTQDLSWVRGTLNLGSHVLSVGRNVTVDPGAGALGVTVADATTAGRLVVTGALAGIERLDLNVAVEAPTAEVAGQCYTILSNSTPLAAQFAAVKWPGAWKGEVDYTGNGGRDVALCNLKKSSGTLFVFR